MYPPRPVYKHSQTGKLYVERNFKPGAFYEASLDNGELIHHDSRHFVDHDVPAANLELIEARRSGVEHFV